MTHRPRPVFVVGCPRSGTSPFARWLHACGLSTVSDDRRNARYPSGYFEPLPLLLFHRALERLPRGADHRITREPYLSNALLDHPFLAKMFELAFEPVLQDRVEFLKYPQLALSLEFLLDQFPNASVVALWRNPLDTFRSLLTKEFPIEMIPASGLKAVLLWSVYAHHLLEARRRWPDRVTIVNVDGFFQDPASGPALMERMGRDRGDAVPIGEAIDLELWRNPTRFRWRAYHGAMSGLCRALGHRLGEERAYFADQRDWLLRLQRHTDLGAPGPR